MTRAILTALAFAGAVAFATNAMAQSITSTVKSSKSNTSDLTGQTPGSNPSAVKGKTIKTTKSNTFREGQTPGSNPPASEKAINLNSSRSN